MKDYKKDSGKGAGTKKHLPKKKKRKKKK